MGATAHLETVHNSQIKHTFSCVKVGSSHKRMNRVHLNALQCSVFRPSCIWISTLLRWSYCYFEQDLPTVTPLMPPWCVIHSASKTSCEAFHSSKPRALFFNHRESSEILQKIIEFDRNRNRNQLWQKERLYDVCKQTPLWYVVVSPKASNRHFFLVIFLAGVNTQTADLARSAPMASQGQLFVCENNNKAQMFRFLRLWQPLQGVYLCCMAHRCQGPQPLTSFYPLRAHFKLSHIKCSG